MPKKSKPKKEHYTLVGMHYRIPKDTRRMIAKHVPFAVYFEREHTNDHDSNAIAVFAADGVLYSGMHLGYLRKEVAAVISPLVDSGEMSLPSFGVVDSINVDRGEAEVEIGLAKPKVKNG